MTKKGGKDARSSSVHGTQQIENCWNRSTSVWKGAYGDQAEEGGGEEDWSSGTRRDKRTSESWLEGEY